MCSCLLIPFNYSVASYLCFSPLGCQIHLSYLIPDGYITIRPSLVNHKFNGHMMGCNYMGCSTCNTWDVVIHMMGCNYM